jgi:hypothetical protein
VVVFAVVSCDVFLIDVGIVPVFAAGNPLQLQRRIISVRKTRRRALLDLFIIVYLLPKTQLKNKQLAIHGTFWLILNRNRGNAMVVMHTSTTDSYSRP